ncbi:Dethiobiotin synthetase [hydrothermal vent metagenome]|uniref:Dethiobiotin synthetase n=1 Tax=hydrothermal vent metagenome TaxID=652676 RepID=A0A1W1CGL7_9ZZZZ
MRPIFISATNTDVGKTYTTLKLIKSFAKRGIKVGVCKPIETGVTTLPLDATELINECKKTNPNFKLLTPFDITAYTFSLPSAPFCADREKTIKIETILNKIDDLSKLCDILLIEGAGGLFVPIIHNYNMIDLAKDSNAFTLLVTPSRLGCINDTLLSIEALKQRGLDYDWCVNLHQDIDSFDEVTKPYYDLVVKEWWSVDSGLDNFVDNYLKLYKSK